MNKIIKRSGIFDGGRELVIVLNESTENEKRRYGLFFVSEKGDFISETDNQTFQEFVIGFRYFIIEKKGDIDKRYDAKLIEWGYEVGTFKELQAKRDLIVDVLDRETLLLNKLGSDIIRFIDVYAFYGFLNMCDDINVARISYCHYLFNIVDYLDDYDFSYFQKRIDAFKSAGGYMNSKSNITISSLIDFTWEQ